MSPSAIALAKRQFDEAVKLRESGFLGPAVVALMVASEHAADAVARANGIYAYGPGNIHQARADAISTLARRGVLSDDPSKLMRALDNDRVGVERHGNKTRFASDHAWNGAVDRVAQLIAAAEGRAASKSVRSVVSPSSRTLAVVLGGVALYVFLLLVWLDEPLGSVADLNDGFVEMLPFVGLILVVVALAYQVRDHRDGAFWAVIGAWAVAIALTVTGAFTDDEKSPSPPRSPARSNGP